MKSWRVQICAAAALAGVALFLAWRSYAVRNRHLGFVPDSGFSTETVVHPDPFAPEEILFPGVAGDPLPVFDLSDPDALPVELEFASFSRSEPFVFRGELKHSHPDFPGGIVRLTVEGRDPGESDWKRLRVEDQATVNENGRFVFRIETRPPTTPGSYRLRFEVMHIKLGVDLDTLPNSFSARTETLAVAAEMVEFRE